MEIIECDKHLMILICNGSISNIDKFNNLVSSLRGAPMYLVRSKPLTAQNDIIAYNSLVNATKIKEP